MTDLKTDTEDFQEIPIDAVIEPIKKADDMLDKVQTILSKKVKEAFPKGTLLQYGQSKYRVIGHGFSWSRPAEVKLKNVKTHGEITINVTLDSDLDKLRILKFPEDDE